MVLPGFLPAHKPSVDGRIAIYGVQFDLNEAEIKPESGVTIRSLAEVLRANPRLKIAVVGHTDSLGSHKTNIVMSKLLADAVVQSSSQLS
jgi:OOP family OmpA-OmpF porin